MSAVQHKKKRVAIVDASPLMRQGLVRLVQEEMGMEICAEAEDTQSALRGLANHKPDIVIMDLDFQDRNGFELIRWIVSHLPGVGVVVFSIHDESLYAERALRAGARGYVNKTTSIAELRAAIRKVMDGGMHVGERVAASILRGVLGHGDSKGSSARTLSDRELQVLELVGQGLQRHQIAHRLHVSAKTIDTYREQIKMKLNLASGASLIRYAVLWTELGVEGGAERDVNPKVRVARSGGSSDPTTRDVARVFGPGKAVGGGEATTGVRRSMTNNDGTVLKSHSR